MLRNESELSDWFDRSSEPVVCCFGAFNVVHPGHVKYFKAARELGGRVLVLLMSNEQIAGELLPDKVRADSLSAFDVVDEVFCLDSKSLTEVIAQYKPDALMLGREFEAERRDDVDGIAQIATECGVRLVYHGGESSTYYYQRLFKESPFEGFDRVRFLDACQRAGVQQYDLLSAVENMAGRSIMVIGDSILDIYIYGEILGTSAEAPVLVFREDSGEQFLGGASIVAAHLSSLGANVSYYSSVGEDVESDQVGGYLRDYNVLPVLIPDSSRPTTVKTRFIVDSQKVFRVSRLKDHELFESVEQNFIEQIRAGLASVDAVVVSDFGYGVVTPKVISTILDYKAERTTKPIVLFGDAQSSSQLNSVAKFVGFDFITPTEKEARLALNSNRHDNIDRVARKLLNGLEVKSLAITMGAMGVISFDASKGGEDADRYYFPALSRNPVDVAGAGDTFLSCASLARLGGASLEVCCAVATIAAGLAVSKLGNQPISSDEIVDAIEFIYGEKV